MKKTFINFVAFQAGWFSCVLGAANGYPLLGPVVVSGVLALHLKLVDDPKNEFVLLLLAASMGAIVDSALVRTGWLVYPNGMIWAGTAPYWIVAMWPLFASTLNVSLRWLHGRPALAALLGGFGGPMSWLAGERLGGLVFVDRTATLIALAVIWATLTPLLVALSQRLDGVQPEALPQHA